MQGYIVQTAIKIINSRIETDANNCQISKSIIIRFCSMRVISNTKRKITDALKLKTVQLLINGIIRPIITFMNSREL